MVAEQEAKNVSLVLAAVGHLLLNPRFLDFIILEAL